MSGAEFYLKDQFSGWTFLGGFIPGVSLPAMIFAAVAVLCSELKNSTETSTLKLLMPRNTQSQPTRTILKLWGSEITDPS